MNAWVSFKLFFFQRGCWFAAKTWCGMQRQTHDQHRTRISGQMTKSGWKTWQTSFQPINSKANMSSSRFSITSLNDTLPNQLPTWDNDNPALKSNVYEHLNTHKINQIHCFVFLQLKEFKSTFVFWSVFWMLTIIFVLDSFFVCGKIISWFFSQKNQWILSRYDSKTKSSSQINLLKTDQHEYLLSNNYLTQQMTSWIYKPTE